MLIKKIAHLYFYYFSTDIVSIYQEPCYSIFTKKKKMETKNVRKQLKTCKNIMKLLSNIGTDKIHIWCKFKVSTVIRF